MQSVPNLNDTNLVDAKTLREMTISKEALFEKQKNGVLDSLMSSMVRQASEVGLTGYSANLNPQFDPLLLGEIVTDLKNLGYEVATEAKSDEKLGSFVQLVIKW